MFRSVQMAAAGLAAAALASGCGGGPGFGDVAGTVTFDGRPLTAGQVVFTNEQDNLMASGYLSPQGKYSIARVPAGPVRVAVRTEEFKDQLDERTVRELRKKGVPVVIENDPNKGTKYVPIPARYADRAQSGLRYEVKPDEANTIEIVLTR